MKDYNTYHQNFNPYSKLGLNSKIENRFLFKHYDSRSGNYVSGKYFDEKAKKYKRKIMCRKTVLEYKPNMKKGAHGEKYTWKFLSWNSTLPSELDLANSDMISLDECLSDYTVGSSYTWSSCSKTASTESDYY